MTIILPINDFTYNLFNVAIGNEDELLTAIKEYYARINQNPDIQVANGLISITYLYDKPTVSGTKYNNLINLCNAGKLNDAIPVAEDIIKTNPENSDTYRILGQVYSELGDNGKAQDYLIESLKLNPDNKDALTMMGNVLVKLDNDIDSALIYYNRAIEISPEDYTALNNIGVNLIQRGKNQGAKEYFKKAFDVNPQYPNTLLGLAVIAESEDDLERSFNYGLDILKLTNEKNIINQKATELIIRVSSNLTNSSRRDIIEKKMLILEKECGKEIRLDEDDSIQTAAKIEFAENYNRDYHLVRYKKTNGYEHLILHELYHLEFIIEARNTKSNLLFTSDENHKELFIKNHQKYISELSKKGIDSSSIKKYMESLFMGLNNQIFNSAIDLFIEERMFNEFPEFRPIQFRSLYQLQEEAIAANTDKKIVSLTPSPILSKSKTLNLVNALLFNDLFHLDFISNYRANPKEIKLANEMFEEYHEYRHDKLPSEEYELTQNWANDLDLDKYFNYISEENYHKSADTLLDEIESSQGIDEFDASQERKMRKFIDEHSSGEINMAVVMYMISALNEFENLTNETVKKIAFEFATMGMAGIDPQKDGYTVPSFKDQSFTGYKALAYYYVSWAVAIPEMLRSLQMPFDKEYDLAITYRKIS